MCTFSKENTLTYSIGDQAFVIYGNGVRSVLLSFVPQTMKRRVLHLKWKAGCGGGVSEHLLLSLVSCAHLGRQKVFPGCFSLEVIFLCFASLLR